MSEISVVVVGSTTVNSVIGNGDSVNVSVLSGVGGQPGAAATIEIGETKTASPTAAASVVNVGTAYAAKLNFSIPQGVTGPSGPPTSFKIGTVTTGATAAVSISGSAPSQTLSFVLQPGPQGIQGIQGIQGEAGPSGPASSLAVGTVTTGATAAVTISGSAPSQTISFVVPRGPQGDSGPYTQIQVGTVTTGAAGSSAKVEAVGTGTVTLNFTIPQGAAGSTNLSDETPQPLGAAASAGTSQGAARADHVHPTPTISYLSLSGIPSTFAPSAHNQAISTITGLQDALDGKQAAGSYATLVNGVVPSSQLPSYVDDVVDVGGALPASGDVGKIYVVSSGASANKVYRWSGSTFVEISSTPGSTDGVVEGTSNLYFTSARAAAAAPVQSVAGRTGDVVLSTADIDGLADALSNTSVDVVDGGDYVGVVVVPTPQITITAQPSSTSVSVNSANEVSSTLPSGTWRAVSRANNRWFVSGYDRTYADYCATSTDGSTWTKSTGLPSAGYWSAMQYANGVYATSDYSTAYSSNLSSWSSAANYAGVTSNGSQFVAYSSGGIYTSTDAANWTQALATTGYWSFLYATDAWFAYRTSSSALSISTNGSTFSSPLTISGSALSSAVKFGGTYYLGIQSGAARTYTTAGGFGFVSGTTAQTYGVVYATDGSILVAYANNGILYTSSNGSTWIARSFPNGTPSSQHGSLYYANGKFVLVLYPTTGSSTRYLTSANGTDWSEGTRLYPSYRSGSYVGDGYFASQSGGAFSYLQIGASTAVATISVSAFFSGSTISYQWQVSTDAGATFANISGATSPTLSLSGLTTADNGKRYRCVLSATGAATVTSNAATLTVT